MKNITDKFREKNTVLIAVMALALAMLTASVIFLGALKPIKESEFEDEIDTLSNDIINENDENEKNSTQNKKNKNWQYKRQITEILMNEETLEKEIPKKNVFNLVRKISLPKINLNQFNKKIEHTYKDPYDYLLSQNYLVMCFIIAIICLVLFNF